MLGRIESDSPPQLAAAEFEASERPIWRGPSAALAGSGCSYAASELGRSPTSGDRLHIHNLATLHPLVSTSKSNHSRVKAV